MNEQVETDLKRLFDIVDKKYPSTKKEILRRAYVYEDKQVFLFFKKGFLRHKGRAAFLYQQIKKTFGNCKAFDQSNATRDGTLPHNEIYYTFIRA